MDALETQIEPSQDATNLVNAHETRVLELVGFLVQGLVQHPDEVEVEEFVDSAGTLYGVHVHPDDTGRVIGREGRVVNALRNLAKASATKIGTHVAVEILTEDD